MIDEDRIQVSKLNKAKTQTFMIRHSWTFKCNRTSVLPAEGVGTLAGAAQGDEKSNTSSPTINH